MTRLRTSTLAFAALLGLLSLGQAEPPTPPSRCEPGVPATRPMVRLNEVEYRNTVRDLFGLEEAPELTLPADTPGELNERDEELYGAAAALIGEAFVADEDARDAALPCQEEQATCFREIIVALGLRAWRRPLTEAEISDQMVLYDGLLDEDRTSDEALGALVEALLGSHQFLHRVEDSTEQEGAYFVLDDYEIASRLSYLYWDTMPDPILFEAAAAGALRTKEQILEQALRMVDDDRVRPVLGKFHEWYLRMNLGTRWDSIDKDPMLYPTFRPELAPLLREETLGFVDYVLFEQEGTFQDLLLSTLTVLNEDLAPFYDLDAESLGPDFQPVDLGAGRPGVFTRLGFLAAHAHEDRTSPILRGAAILKRVLCTSIDSLPGEGPSTALPDDPALVTNRQRVDAQTSAAPCLGCHSMINPLGYVFEGFDAIGQVQTTEGGAPIDTAGSVFIGGGEVPVAHPVELMENLARSPEAQHCYATAMVSAAYNRERNPNDECVVEELATRLAYEDFTIRDLLADLSQAESFRLRAEQDFGNGSGSGAGQGATGAGGSGAGGSGAAAAPSNGAGADSGGGVRGGAASSSGAASGNGPTSNGGEARGGESAFIVDAGADRSGTAEGLRGVSMGGRGCGCRAADGRTGGSTALLQVVALLALGARRRAGSTGRDRHDNGLPAVLRVGA